MKKIFFVPLFVLLLIGAGCNSASVDEIATDETQPTQSSTLNTMTYTFPGVLEAAQIENKQARITTEKGDIVFALFADTAPATVSNFVYLAGLGYFDGLTFHRRVEGFVIQGGDPSGDGTGGPGYTIAEEVNDERQYARGIVAMAKRPEPHTSGSQFFIMLEDYPLDKDYTIFGEVILGQDVVDAIAIGDVMSRVTIEDATTGL